MSVATRMNGHYSALLLRLIGLGLMPVGARTVGVVNVFHDDMCPANLGYTCNCNPIIKVGDKSYEYADYFPEENNHE